MSDSSPRVAMRRFCVGLGLIVSTLLGTAAHAQAAVESTSQLVVMVSGDLDGAPTLGAGIIFGRDADGFHVVTANHVVRRAAREATQLRILLKGLPNRWLEARLLPHADPSPPGIDVAVLVVRGLLHDGWNACALAVDRLVSPGALERGAAVFPVGYPGGVPWGMPVAPDLVAQVVGAEITFQSAVVANGHSGGALITADGGLAGMVRLDNPPFGVAVSIATVLDRLRQWGYPVALRATGSAPPLYAAAEKHDAAAVERALGDRCVAIDGLHEGWSALHEAAQQGDASIVRALLAAGANKGLRIDNREHQENRMTPLALAAGEGRVEVIRVLLKAGTGTEDRGELANSRTPLERAVKAGHRDAARALRDAGASTDFLRRLEVGSPRGYPLHAAARSGNVAVARLMLELGADVNALDSEDGAPIHRAVEAGQRELVALLLAAGAKLDRSDEYRRTPLGRAVLGVPADALDTGRDAKERENGLAIVELLVKAGADVTHAEGRGEDRRTALDLAAWWGSLSVVKRLLALGVDVDLKNGRGQTALHAAAEMGGNERAAPTQRAMLETLRAAGANVNAVDQVGDPPLCRALWGDPALGRIVVIELLLRWGARPLMMDSCRYQSGRSWAPDAKIDALLRSRGATDVPAR